jgi:peroxiredoxin Q/BCP
MLDEGDRAPDFELESDAGETVSLGDFAGKWLILYFYPRDNTPGCTREAQAFSEAAARISKLGAAVAGVSKDSVKSHCGFKEKYALKLPLLSDPSLAVHKKYGAYGTKTMYGKKVEGVLRTTYVIDPKGKIAKVFPSVKVDGHADKVIDAVKELKDGTSAAKPRRGRTEA